MAYPADRGRSAAANPAGRSGGRYEARVLTLAELHQESPLRARLANGPPGPATRWLRWLRGDVRTRRAGRAGPGQRTPDFISPSLLYRVPRRGWPAF